MGTLLDYITEQSKISTTGGSSWVDTVANAIKTNTINITNPEFKSSVLDAVQVLLDNKDNISDLGVYGLVLFLQKLASGSEEQAYITWIASSASVQQLIDGENSSAANIINKKVQHDKAVAEAKNIALTIGMDTIKILIPLLLGVI